MRYGTRLGQLVFHLHGTAPGGMYRTYDIAYEGKTVATAIHYKRPGYWYVIGEGHMKGVNGLRTRQDVHNFVRQFIISNPWYDDPAIAGYSEYSEDQRYWHRERQPEDRYMRYVGVTLSIELKEKTDD